MLRQQPKPGRGELLGAVGCELPCTPAGRNVFVQAARAAQRDCRWRYLCLRERAAVLASLGRQFKEAKRCPLRTGNACRHRPVPDMRRPRRSQRLRGWVPHFDPAFLLRGTRLGSRAGELVAEHCVFQDLQHGQCRRTGFVGSRERSPQPATDGGHGRGAGAIWRAASHSSPPRARRVPCAGHGYLLAALRGHSRADTTGLGGGAYTPLWRWRCTRGAERTFCCGGTFTACSTPAM